MRNTDNLVLLKFFYTKHFTDQGSLYFKIGTTGLSETGLCNEGERLDVLAVTLLSVF